MGQSPEDPFEVLVVDHEVTRGRALGALLASNARVVSSVEAAQSQPTRPDVVVCVEPTRVVDVMALRAWLETGQKPADVFVVSASHLDAAPFFAAGADDVVMGTLVGPVLAERLKASRRAREADRTVAQLRRSLPDAQAALVYGPQRYEVVRAAYRVASADTSVLITGETGTGKELMARLIHEASPRAQGPFVTLNVAALPSELVEAELFGHASGAFTGAAHAREGRVEAAASGTLFLDEVGDMPARAQVKLLRLLQERTFERLGETRVRKADFRLVCATHRDLSALVDAGSFREDLFYRLDVVHLELAPLRHRGAEVMALARHYLEAFSRAAGRRVTLSDEAWAAIARHDWPGNIRELKNSIERAVTSSSDGDVIGSDLVRPRGLANPVALVMADVVAGRATLDSLLAGVEGALLQCALRLSQGSQTKAAELLGLPRQTLANRLRKQGHSAQSFDHQVHETPRAHRNEPP